MIRQPSFWTEEAEAPLLRRNANHLTLDNAAQRIGRAQHWVDVARERLAAADSSVEVNQAAVAYEPDEAIRRIFDLDAERTFVSPQRRQQHIDTLTRIHRVIGDYHQGLGFVVAFLLLLLPADDVVTIILALHQAYVPGYFKTAPVNYVRDAKVFERLLAERAPELHERLTGTVPAEAYCSKWFVGFNVHVLPFEALMDYFEDFMKDEEAVSHFKFALSLCQVLQDQLLAKKDDAERTLALLRLDEKYVSGEGAIFSEIVGTMAQQKLDMAAIDEWRNEILAEMAAAEERRRLWVPPAHDEDEIRFSDEEDD